MNSRLEPPFLRRLRLYVDLSGKSQREKSCTSKKHDVSSIYEDTCDLKKIFINNSRFQSSKGKFVQPGAGAAWSCTFLPGADQIWLESAPGFRTSRAGAAGKRPLFEFYLSM